jgi:4-amino-4-deoxy-L-arabinose transferase-like glycosyltransferase
MRSELMSRLMTPVGVLVLVSALSLAARAAWLAEPCRRPCVTASDHTLVFDESYYVNAARVIAGIEPPAGATYAGSPLGDDPNAEHPQGVKLIIAGLIELFGDGPLAWRLGSLVFGSLAILGLYALVRAAGGSQWLAVGAAALMAFDPLLLIAGRIGILDIYVVAAMLWGTALYLRGRALAAGVVLGIGACFKLVAPYALFVLVLFEALMLLHRRPLSRAYLAGVVRRLGVCVATSVAVFVGLLAILDRIAPPFDATTGHLIKGGPFAHIAHMFSYAAQQTSPNGPQGIASYPWQWLFDFKPITYLNINPAKPAPGLYNIYPASHFFGVISPPILVLALPGLVLAAVWLWRGRRRGATVEGGSGATVGGASGATVKGGWGAAVEGGRGDPSGAGQAELQALIVAWFLGTWLPFEALSLVYSRTSYIYYMIIVMPALYIAAALLVARVGVRRRIVLVWMVAVVAAAVILYPFTPLP